MNESQLPGRLRFTRNPRTSGAIIPALLAIFSYVPLLFTAPGVVAADTKLYLYLDPWRLMGDALYTWDSRQLGGWVPHQNVGYLWPSGPWYALFDLLGFPDWVTQRLWLGTILVLAGIGTWWLCRVLELPRPVAVTAAFAYQMSPYVLPYISRTSALLLPWAMLPFMIALTARMCRDFRWRYLLGFAVAIATAGGLNATALLMVLPGPALWLIVELVERRISRRAFVGVGALLATATVGASAWWMAGLSTQGAYGAPVLSYSETLPSTSATSTATESLRGLGYWLFYDRPAVTPLTTASTPYQNNLIVILAGVLIAIAAVAGVVGATRHRRALSGLLLGGVVLAVGAYPFGDSSPLWSFFADRPTSGISLALRSSSRAVPLISLALAIGLGHTVMRLHQRMNSVALRRSASRFVIPSITAVALLVNLPALVGGKLIDPNVSRPEEIPQAWFDAAEYLDRSFETGREGAVLILPGIESQAFRWGYTVDPILPGLTRKPMITRDWLPLGSAPYMDLLYALDDAMQNGTARPETIAPVARLLGADTVMVVNTFQYERFSTVRPERAADVINGSTPGLTHLADFGVPNENRAPADSEPHRGELADYPFTQFPEIQLYAVDSPFVAGTTSHPAVVSGDGSSLVDLAATGLLDEPGIRLMSASLTGDELRQAVADAEQVVVTDGNRIRAHQWRGSQEVWGATEPVTGVVDQHDIFDSRLPVFPITVEDTSTRSYIETGPVTATASLYGSLLSYRPEFRPTMAVDGDASTGWMVGWGIDPVGQVLHIRASTPVDHLDLKPDSITGDTDGPAPAISAVDVRIDNGVWIRVDSPSGSIELPAAATIIDIRIAAISGVAVNVGIDGAVGFSEVLPPSLTSPEIVRVPRDATDASPHDMPVSYSFSRLRSDPYSIGTGGSGRRDPETAIRRAFSVPHDDAFVVTGRMSHPTTDPAASSACRDDLVELDGVPISVRLMDDDSFASCDGTPLTVLAGEHTLIALAPDGLTPDSILLRSSLAPKNKSASSSLSVHGDRTSRTVELNPCAAATECWVQIPDGWNTGWSASIDGERLAEPIAAASGRNIWALTDRTGGTLTSTWQPQQRMWIGVAITILTLTVLAVLSLLPATRRRRYFEPRTDIRGSAPDIGRIGLPIIVSIVGVLVISPVWGLVSGVIILFTPRRRLARLGAHIVALAMLFILAQQLRTGASPGFGWPSVFHRAHRPALVGLVLIAVAAWFVPTDEDPPLATPNQ